MMKSTLMVTFAAMAFAGAGVALADGGHGRHAGHGPAASAPSAGGNAAQPNAAQPNASQRQQRMNERHSRMNERHGRMAEHQGRMAERHAQMAERHGRMGEHRHNAQPNGAPGGDANTTPRGNHEHRHDGTGPRRG